ncbi:MAG: type 4a pilus biogenesis protein PilO [Bacillota bacterium]
MARRPLTKQEIILVGVMAIAALCGGFYQLLLSPTMARAEQIQNEVSAMEAKIGQIRKELRDQEELERKLEQAKSDLASFEMLIPDEKEIPDLLRELELIAERCNVQLSSIAASRPIDRKTHQEINLSLPISGKYRDVLRFFDEITSAKRLIIVKSASISPGSEIFDVNIQASAFMRGGADNGKK